MIDLTALLKVIVRQVQKHLGDKSLNEMIEAGIAVYLEVAAAIPKSRSITKPHADLTVLKAVFEELALEE